MNAESGQTSLPKICHAMQADIDGSGLSRAQIAQALHLSSGDDPGGVRAAELLHKIVRGERKFPHWQLGRWVRITQGHALIDAICKDAGGIFVPVPDCGPGDESVLVESINEFAEFAKEASACHLPDSDGGAVTTAEEAEQTEREGMEAIVGILRLIELRNAEAHRKASPYAASIAEAVMMRGTES